MGQECNHDKEKSNRHINRNNVVHNFLRVFTNA